MTLVVAEQHGSGITLVADTKLTYKDSRTNPYFEGGLKIVILSPALCIGLAGPYDPHFLSELVAARHGRPRDVAEVARRWSKNDVLIAGLDDGPELLRVSGGTVEQRRGRAGIGDMGAYSKFQEAYFARGTETGDPGWRLLASMQWVLDHGGGATVGGFHVRAASTPAGFRFLGDGSFVGPDSMVGTVDVEGNRVTLHMRPDGSPSSYQMLCCPGVAPTIGACGYFVTSAHAGVLWPHLEPWAPTKIGARSVQEFIDVAARDYGQILARPPRPHTITTTPQHR